MHFTNYAHLHRLDADTSILINSLSGAVDLLDGKTTRTLLELQSGQDADLTAQMVSALLSRGYLYPTAAEERAALTRLFQTSRRFDATRPLQFIICPTYACNLACAYCFEESENKLRPEVMTSAQVEQAFSVMRTLQEQQPDRLCQIVLFGGEPLLPITQSAVEQILAQAHTRGYPVQAVTNGTYLPLFAPLIRQYRGLWRGVQITLDGPKEYHDARRFSRSGQGTFEDVIAAVELCLTSGLEVNLRINLDAHNLAALVDLAKLIKNYGWTDHPGFRSQLAPVTDHLGTSQYAHSLREDQLVAPVMAFRRNYPELAKVFEFQLFRVLHHLMSIIEGVGHENTPPRFHYCEADRGDLFCFGPDGLLYLCPESAGNPNYSIGRYAPDYQLWPNRLSEWRARDVLSLPECRECSIATFCGGGCGYAALHQYGSPQHGVCAGAPEIFSSYLDSLRQARQKLSSAAPV